jgi:integrase
MVGSAKRTVRTALRAVLDYAVRDKLIAANPAAAVDRPRVPKSVLNPLDKGQTANARQLIAGDRIEPLFLLLMATGMRRGEAVGLKWTDITDNAITARRSVNRVEGVSLVTGTVNGDKIRTVPLGPGLAKVLARQKCAQASRGSLPGARGATRAGCSPTRSADCSNLEGCFGRPNVTGLRRIHQLRTTAATEILAGGADIAVVQQLGHSSLLTTQRFVAAHPAAQEAGAALIDV